MWKRLLPFLFVSSLLQASPLKSKPVYDFSKGLDTYHSSLSLPDGYVQKSLNVLFDAQAPVSKRQGYTEAWSNQVSSVIVITAGVNDQFELFHGGSPSTAYLVTVAPGNYSPTSLASTITTEMSAQGSLGGTYSLAMVFNGSNFVYQSNTVSTPQLRFGFGYTSRDIGPTLGWTDGSHLPSGSGPVYASTATNTPVYTQTGPAYQSLWSYTDPTNTSWQIVRASTQIFANNLSGSASVLVATVSASNLVGEANAFGNAYFVDQTQGVYYWNGTSTTYVNGSPKGSLISQWHNRLWVAGLAVPNGNLLYGSSNFSGTIWAPGVNPNDPVILTVGTADNFDNISALYPFLDTLYVFKHFATYAVYGFDQTSFQISFITAECGCIDQQSIQTYNAALIFMSERGVESFNGYTCTRISDPVKNMVDNAIMSQGGSTINSWVQSSQADWNAGTITPSGNLTTSSGLTTSTSGVVDPLSNASLWTSVSGVNTFSASGVNLSTQSSSGSPSFVNAEITSAQTVPTNQYILEASVQWTYNNSPSMGNLYIEALDSSNNGYALWEKGQGRSPGSNFDNELHIAVVTGGVVGSDIGAAIGPSLVDYNFHTMALVRSTAGVFNAYWDNTFVSSGTDTTYSTIPTNEVIISTWNPVNNLINNQINVANLYIVPGSGSFQSQVHGAVSINAWTNFSVSDSLDGGNIAFSLCSSTNSNMSVPVSCANQLPNTQITLSTATYVQWYATFSITDVSQNPTVNSVSVGWTSGNRSPSMSSTIWDNRYWLSLTTAPTDTANDAILVLGSKGAWSLLDLHAGGLAQYKNSLYHSNSLGDGDIYLDNQGYQDDVGGSINPQGYPINAYIQSKDYCEQGPPEEEYYESLYPSMDDGGNYNMTISYIMDRDATSPYSLSTVNQTEFSNNTAIKIPFVLSASNQNFGKCINFTFTESDANSPWSFYGWSAYYHEREVQ